MKNVCVALLILASTIFGNSQSLQRDNLLGIHVMDIQLNPGITLEDFSTFFVSKVIPEYEKHWIGLKGHLVKSVRGEYKDKLAVMWVFATEPTRDYYFNPDGTMNEREVIALKKVEKIEDELKTKFGSYTVEYKDDWVVK